MCRNENGFTTSLYRKPTYTGLTMKFSSFLPISYKRNLVSTLTARLFHICSSYSEIEKELEFLRNTLFLNGFNRNFTDLYLGKQLQKLLCPTLPKANVKKAIAYFVISFTGKKSFSLKNRLSRLMTEFYPQINVRVIFKPARTIQSFFRYKDVIPKELQSSIIYKYNCNCCNAMYIGRTKRHLSERIFQHLGKSLRTNRPLKNPCYSAIRQHSENLDHPITKDSFNILSSRKSEMELEIVESLFIFKEKPSLCSNDRSTELFCF